MKGKAYFKRLAQIHFNKGTEMLYYTKYSKNWPKWAKIAYMEVIV